MRAYGTVALYSGYISQDPQRLYDLPAGRSSLEISLKSVSLLAGAMTALYRYSHWVAVRSEERIY